MNRMEELINMVKINEFIRKQELEEQQKKTVCLVFTIIAGIAAIAALAIVIYKLVNKDDEYDFDIDCEDEFDEDDFEEEEDDFVDEDAPAEEEKAEEEE